MIYDKILLKEGNWQPSRKWCVKKFALTRLTTVALRAPSVSLVGLVKIGNNNCRQGEKIVDIYQPEAKATLKKIRKNL